MHEILPGLLHWTARHPKIEMDVSSHYYEPGAALFDPLEPDGGLGFLDGRAQPERIVLTCRHHLRDSAELSERFGATVHCNELGLHEFEGAEVRVKGFRPGDQVAPGIEALQMGSIAPDDTVLSLDVEGGALAFADALIHYGGEVSFVPGLPAGGSCGGQARHARLPGGAAGARGRHAAVRPRRSDRGRRARGAAALHGQPALLSDRGALGSAR